jgi:hypothetical protein
MSGMQLDSSLGSSGQRSPGEGVRRGESGARLTMVNEVEVPRSGPHRRRGCAERVAPLSHLWTAPQPTRSTRRPAHRSDSADARAGAPLGGFSSLRSGSDRLPGETSESRLRTPRAATINRQRRHAVARASANLPARVYRTSVAFGVGVGTGTASSRITGSRSRTPRVPRRTRRTSRSSRVHSIGQRNSDPSREHRGGTAG